MSARTQLYSLARSIIKRPVAWLGGIIVAGFAAATTDHVKDFFKSAETSISETVAGLSCRYSQKPIANESQFTILVSPLAHDPDQSYTEKVQRAFSSEEGFRAVRICDSLDFDLSKDSQSARDDTLQRARALINEKHADLLLFGYVSDPGKAVVIYAVNEHGGCDDPKPTDIKQGALGSDFTTEEKERLIEVSLEQIQSACLNQSSIDWPLFAKRMGKMEKFLKYFDFNQEKFFVLASSYVQAARLLYENDQGEVWFSKGETFAKSIIDKKQGSGKALRSIYAEYALLFSARFDKTDDKHDLDAYLQALDNAISRDPNNAVDYSNRCNSYVKKGDLDRAIEDCDKAIGLDPKYAAAYINRGNAFNNKHDWDRAIADYDKGTSKNIRLRRDDRRLRSPWCRFPV
jgi:tetratricopeptide (TPR) repeat protein